ncbi:hypothetical protein AB8965_11100 [Yersinia enterocolitica]|uniref:hypothetical protein n=1 Tax=Yersinia enterocolitica TaxID=630 RepID=UPI003D03696E
MDFGIPLNPAFYIHKRGDSLDSSISVDGESIDMPELDIGKSLYGYVGVGVTYKFIPFTNRIITDGMNEAGLNASMLFIENTKYQQIGITASFSPSITPLCCETHTFHLLALYFYKSTCYKKGPISAFLLICPSCILYK